MSPIINFSVLQAVLNGPQSLLFLAIVGGFLLFAIVHSIASELGASVSRGSRPAAARRSDDRPADDGHQQTDQRRAA